MCRRDMIYEELQMVLELYMFLKKKGGGKIKGHTVSGGNKKWTYIPKEYSSYPSFRT